MKRALCLFVLVLAAAGVHADDDLVVNVDAAFDFDEAKTFALEPPRIDSRKAEINNRLFVQKMDGAIRDALRKKSLQETGDGPDLVVTYTLAVVDHSVVGGQRGYRIPDGPPGSGIRGMVVDGTGPLPAIYTEGTLVVSVRSTATNAVVWRGTCRDEERSGPRLAGSLPKNAARLLAKFP